MIAVLSVTVIVHMHVHNRRLDVSSSLPMHAHQQHPQGPTRSALSPRTPTAQPGLLSPLPVKRTYGAAVAKSQNERAPCVCKILATASVSSHTPVTLEHAENEPEANDNDEDGNVF